MNTVCLVASRRLSLHHRFWVVLPTAKGRARNGQAVWQAGHQLDAGHKALCPASQGAKRSHTLPDLKRSVTLYAHVLRNTGIIRTIKRRSECTDPAPRADSRARAYTPYGTSTHGRARPIKMRKAESVPFCSLTVQEPFRPQTERRLKIRHTRALLAR